ncbi:MAG TPA: hemerythrin domain-containing protein [Pyrinomonadaceae bacterium]|nr:hemerythrin domain-containing protein [Pyrinomonadaceae bacterium]
MEAVAGVFAPGSPGAIDLLKTDHRKVEELFAKVKANEDGNNGATFKKIKQELDIHAHIEEQIFYPHLLDKGDKELKEIVREGLEEHAQVKGLLAELAELSGTSPAFKAKITVLMENVEHHVEEEEGEMFSMVEDQIPEETLQRIGSLMMGEKSKFKGGTAASRGRSKSRKPTVARRT